MGTEARDIGSILLIMGVTITTATFLVMLVDTIPEDILASFKDNPFPVLLAVGGFLIFAGWMIKERAKNNGQS